MNPAHFLRQFNGHKILKMQTVEFTENYSDENSTPFVFLMTFDTPDTFLKIELNNDCDHIDIEPTQADQLDKVLAEYTNDVWKPNDASNREPFDKIVGRPIGKIELAIDKQNYEINGKTFRSVPSTFSGIRFHFGCDNLIIFNNGDESYIGLNSDKVPAFTQSYDWYGTE